MAGLKRATYRLLVATDIAARSIDVTALGHVINFDVPAVPEDYIHRVGRTARAELTGSAFTLVAPEDEPSIRAIERAINKRLRSEEHTSELQSRVDLVCRLLLEKKKYRALERRPIGCARGVQSQLSADE